MFHLVGLDLRGELSRKQLLHVTANLQVELMGMEACGGSIFLAVPYEKKGMRFG